MNNLKNAAEVKAAANKKPYIKPDFEVINLEDTPKLLAASGPVNSTFGFNLNTIDNGADF